MRLRPLILVLLAGCGETTAFRRGEPQPWTGDPAPVASPTPWHRDQRTGLAARLVAKGPYTLGNPMPVALEMKNQGERTVCFDVQGLLHLPFGLATAAGKWLPNVHPNGHRGQSWQRIESLAPGESKEFRTIDLAAIFPLAEDGIYALRFWGLDRWGMGDDGSIPGEAPSGSVLSAVPESAPLRIEIAPGEVRPRDQLLLRLFPLLPERWRLYDGSGEGAIAAVLYRSNLDSFGRWAFVTVGCGKAPEKARRLGASPFGETWISPVLVARMDARNAEDERLEKEIASTVVPSLEERILKAFDIR